MSNEMEVDEDTPTETSVNTSNVEPLLQTSPFVEKGIKLCIICFSGATKKNAKRAKLQEITDVKSYQARALKWTKYEHSYNKIYKTMDWKKSGEFYTHKSCKGFFGKDSYMLSQTEIPQSSTEVQHPTPPSTQSTDYNDDKEAKQDEFRRSARQKFNYQSSQEESKCIICVTGKKDKHGNIIPVLTMTFRETQDSEHLAEKQLKDFSKIHVDNCTKFKEAGERILLNSSITLFAANVGYHKSCYQAFRAPSWKKMLANSEYSNSFERNCIDELVGAVEYLVVVKREVYTLRQLRELFANIKGVQIDLIRSIDIKRLLKERLDEKLQFCMPTCASSSHGIQTEYVLSADANILPDAINAIITGEGVSSYMQLKAIACLISLDIQSREKIPWPPTPQDILESDELLELDMRLFNLLAWIVSPNASMGKNGFVGLSYRKATKVSEIVQNIQSLVPGSQPGFNQILLSITTLAKTGSQMVVNDLKQLGHGVSNTEAMFIQDKWA